MKYLEVYYETYRNQALDAGFKEEDYLIFISNRYGIDKRWGIDSNKQYLETLIYKIGTLLKFIYLVGNSLDEEFNTLNPSMKYLTSINEFKTYLLEVNVHTSPSKANLRKEGLRWYEFIKQKAVR